jgi:hypothetical protein
MLLLLPPPPTPPPPPPPPPTCLSVAEMTESGEGVGAYKALELVQRREEEKEEEERLWDEVEEEEEEKHACALRSLAWKRRARESKKG